MVMPKASAVPEGAPKIIARATIANTPGPGVIPKMKIARKKVMPPSMLAAGFQQAARFRCQRWRGRCRP